MASTVRRATTKPVTAAEYNERNTELFTERLSIKADLVAATEAGEGTARLLRRLNRIDSEIVDLNYGLVHNYTRKFTSNSSREDSADFEAAACLGLMRAIDTFDPALGKFASWAYKPIQREVLQAVRGADFQSLANGDFERRPAILAAVARLQATSDIDVQPTHAQIADEAGMTVEQVRRVLEAPKLDSLHQPMGEDGDGELGDMIQGRETSVEGRVLSAMTITALEDFGLRALDERELFVLVRRYGLDCEPEQKLASIGEMLSLSREAVRQVESKALAKIMHPVLLRKLQRLGRP